MRIATNEETGHVALVNRQPGQCNCAWCGKALRCPDSCLSPPCRDFIKAFAHEHGRRWKSILNKQWLDAQGPHESIVIRNSFGPSWLTWFRLSKIEDIDDRIALRERIKKRAYKL